MSSRPTERHAYMIQAHTDQRQLAQLLRALDDERNDILVHLDKRCQDFGPQDFSCQRAQLRFIEERVAVYWGDHSQLEAEFRLFAAARALGTHRIYHLLSGADMPLKSQDYIHDFIAAHPDTDFVGLWLDPAARHDARYKVARYHFGMKWEKSLRQPQLSIALAKLRHLLAELLLQLRGPRPFIGEPVKGSQWMSLSQKTLDFILSQQKQLLKRYRHMRCPDELFIASLLYNSPEHRARIYDAAHRTGDLRYMLWSEESSSPRTLGIEQLEDLLASPMLFARKFSSDTAPELSEALLASYASQPPFQGQRSQAQEDAATVSPPSPHTSL